MAGAYPRTRGKINGEYYGTGQTQLLGFVVVDMGVFLGIILGCTIAWVHNKVSTIELPGALSMYGGAKLTLVAMTPVVIFYAIAFTWIWPFMTHGIAALTGFMKNAGVAGVFVYGFFENSSSPPACTTSSGRRSSSRKSAER